MNPARRLIPAIIILLLATAMHAQSISDNTTGATFDAKAADRFARLALTCVHKEYPNKISHTMNGDADVAPPRKLTPAFYGCYAGTPLFTDTGCSCALCACSPKPSLHRRLALRLRKA